MDYFMGIDGGGTKTKVAIIDDNTHVVYIGVGGPSSIDTVNHQTSLKHIEDALNALNNKQSHYRIKSLFCGLGGIVTDNDSVIVESFLRNVSIIDENTHIIARNDMENALFSGGCFTSGMTLICGTGMVAYAKNEQGNSHKSGGWGFKEGDHGSAFDLGMKALRYVSKAFDGRCELTAFAIDIANSIGMIKASDITRIMHENYENRTWIAHLAPLVTKYANLGDPLAKHMVDTATTDLQLAVSAVYHRIKPENNTLVLVGSLGQSIGYFGEELKRKIHEIDPHIKIIHPLYDPAVAAAMMAKRQNESSL